MNVNGAVGTSAHGCERTPKRIPPFHASGSGRHNLAGGRVGVLSRGMPGVSESEVVQPAIIVNTSADLKIQDWGRSTVAQVYGGQALRQTRG